MKCPECVASGQKSRVFHDGTTSTLMYFAPYWDEDGVRHSHDGNTLTNEFSCTNGHNWNYRFLADCPAGDFGGPIETPAESAGLIRIDLSGSSETHLE